MKHQMRIFQIALSMCLLLSLVMVRSGTAAPPSLIDHFTTAQFLKITWPGGAVAPITTFNATSGANILGGERDLIATVWSANPSNLSAQDYTADVANHSLNISSGVDLLFTTELQWDGSADVNKEVINPTGLGGVNLTTGGQNRFIFGLPSSDVGGKFTVRVYSSTTACSQSTWTFSGGINSYNMAVVERTYAAFVPPFAGASICSGYSSLAVFSNVGAISLTIASSLTDSSLDMSMDLVGEDIAPYKDYGDLPDDGGAAYRYEWFKDASLANAFHVDTGLTLGPAIDLENVKPTDGLDTATADNFDDGITPSALPWFGGAQGQVSVVVNGCPAANCYLTGFVDWNQDGSFWDVDGDTWQVGERILANAPVTNGGQTVNFDIPVIVGITDGSFANLTFFARFRITDTPFSQPTAYGAAFSGEVEDYLWTFSPTAVKIDRLTATSPTAPLQPILPFAAAAAIAAVALLAGFVLRRK